MKYAFYVAGLAVAIIVGWGKGILRPTRWRALLAIILIAVGIIGGLYPPIVGTFQDAIVESRGKPVSINVLLPPNGIMPLSDSVIWCRDISGSTVKARMVKNNKTVMAQSIPQKLLIHTSPITHDFFDISSVTHAPWIMLPYIPGLGERARILFFHVPAAWTGFLAYVITMLYSLRYLRTSREEDDAVAVASASIGTLFTILAYISGAIWAKFNWGHFFNWDTRELSVLLLLAIYIAYFVLRANIRSDAQKRVAATYAIVAAVAALFLIFIVPRITTSLHPGSRDDTNIGPILSPEQDTLDTTKAAIFSIMLAGFTLLYSWMLNFVARYRLIANYFQHSHSKTYHD
ncbi:MAG: hypothetical protein KatS3mg039_0746 [Candidatus Kapaibacterium sp.]|nr:MAG: hypothetical protein KatS3mg039_0746 [Candidatus Kapabacteria bacterium]